MKGNTIDLLGLNIGANISVTLNTFHYKLYTEDERHIVDVSYDAKPEGEGWIASQTVVGEYCGDRHDAGSGEMVMFKLRVREPFKMSRAYGSYLAISPQDINSIKVLQNGLPTVLDTLSHALSGLGGEASLDN